MKKQKFRVLGKRLLTAVLLLAFIGGIGGAGARGRYVRAEAGQEASQDKKGEEEKKNGKDKQKITGEDVRKRDMQYREISYEEELAEAKNSIDLGDVTAVAKDLILPQSYGIHVRIDWKSSDESVVSRKGKVAVPEEAEGDKQVVLAATLSSTMTDAKETATFEVTVKALSVEEYLNAEADKVQNYVDYLMNDGYRLPGKKEMGLASDLSWSVASGSARIEEGRLKKMEGAAEREPVVLEAVLEKGGSKKTVVLENRLLLEKYEGYILSFFGGNDDRKSVHLAYSLDGINWEPLNGGETILTAEAMVKKKKEELRDPFIIRKKDGSFELLVTNGWTSDSVHLWDSADLVTFENERTSVLSVEGAVGLSGRHVWAPECNYNPTTDEYTVYWSDPKADDNNGNTYYNTTKDFQTFSEPGILYDRDITMIDASIKKYKGRYYMAYNDAYGDNETGKGGKIIYLAASDSLEPGSFRQISGAISPAGVISEGPFLMEDFRTGDWYAMYDHYGLHKYGVSRTGDLESDKWEYLGVSETMPTENIRHGGALPVTEKELEQIIDAWGSEEQKSSWKAELAKVQKEAEKRSAEEEQDGHKEVSEKEERQDGKVQSRFKGIIESPVTWVIAVLAAGVLAGAVLILRQRRK